MPERIRIHNAALDDHEGDIILRGVIDPASMQHLLIAPYQREVLPVSSLSSLIKAFEAGDNVPDIELGMRGERVTSRGGAYFLSDPVFIVDGLQRISAAKNVLASGKRQPHIGAAIHFNTDETSERERFRILNAHRAKLSPNVMLRNLEHDLPVIDMLHQLTTGGSNPNFCLSGRVCWSQRSSRHEVLTGLTLAKVVGALHSHVGPGRSSNYEDLARGLQKISDEIGTHIMRENILRFFELIDQCWDVRNVAYASSSPHLRMNFLVSLALVMSNHTDFWRDTLLAIDPALRRKISTFRVHDPHISSLTGSNGKAGDILKVLIVDHINSGKRTMRLKLRDGLIREDTPNESEDDLEAAG